MHRRLVVPQTRLVPHAGAGGWGFGLNVVTRRTDLGPGPGSFGWNGGTVTSFYVDPAEELIGVLLTQRSMTSPRPPAVGLRQLRDRP